MKDYINKLKERFNKIKKEFDNGFSLIEMVVALGVMSILLAGGGTTYYSVQKNLMKGSVERVAGETMKDAWDWFYDGNIYTNPALAATVANETSNYGIKSTVVVDFNCVKIHSSTDRMGGHSADRELCVDESLIDSITGEVIKEVPENKSE